MWLMATNPVASVEVEVMIGSSEKEFLEESLRKSEIPPEGLGCELIENHRYQVLVKHE